MTDLSQGDDLRRRHCYHLGADRVTDPLFQSDDFFDPRDLLLVKYELLRRVRCDGVPIVRAVVRFAVSRATYYQTYRAWTVRGLLGLLPRPTGPRQGYKLTADIVATLAPADGADAVADAAELARRLWAEHRLRVHPRSIARALRPRQKGGRSRTRWAASPTGTSVTKPCGPPGWTGGAPAAVR